MRRKCQEYSVGGSCTVWYDPERPYRSTIYKINLLSYLLPLAALLSGAAILATVNVGTVGLACLAVAWFLTHGLASFVMTFLQDAWDVVALAARRLESCPTRPSFDCDLEFFAANEQELGRLRFKDVGALRAPLLPLAHHENIDRLFVSDDRLTLAVVGEVRYQGRLWGVVPIPWLGHRGVYFHSRFPDGSLMETLRGDEQNSEPDAVGKISNRVSSDASLDDLYRSHVEQVAQHATNSSVAPCEYISFDDCVASVKFDIEKGLDGPASCFVDPNEPVAVPS